MGDVIQNYNAESVQQLTFREGVRARVGIYLGSADHTGVLAGLLELVNNATDEALVCPTATEIIIEVGDDWASCRDFGRGMPHGPNSFSNEVMINLLTENHSGAKFNDNAYGGKSRGLNGTGSAATCCSSDWFKISSYRDGAEWYMEFYEGIPKWEECQKKPLGANKQGTFIIYKPSQSVFKSEPIKFDYEEVCNQMKEYSYFNKGITFIVKKAGTSEEHRYISKNGLMDFVKENLDKPIHKTPLHYTLTENDIDAEIILQWTGNREEKFYLFSNGGENQNGGTPITGIKTSLTNFFKKKIKGDANPDILRKGLTYVCSVNLKDPIYDGQTKSKITNPELRGMCQRMTTRMLEDFEHYHASEFEQIITLLTKEIKADAAAERERQKVLNAAKEIENNQKKKVMVSDKLKDAEYLGENSMLLVCEGDSALGGVAQGRDSTTYGLLALRGKIINAHANSDEKIYESEEVKLLLSAMGIIPGKYDAKKLRYGRLGVCVDADADGGHIALLIFSLLAHTAPEFIKEGRLYWLRSPLWIEEYKGKEIYYFTDKEKDAARSKIKGHLFRNKGLGSLEADQVRVSMFSPEYQRLDKIEYSEEGMKLLYELMGEDVGYRKEFIMNNIDFGEIRE